MEHICFSRIRVLVSAFVLMACFPLVTWAQDIAEPPLLAAEVGSGNLPPMKERLPDNPLVLDMKAIGKEYGTYGGTIHTLMANSKDIRMMTVYGYARLVGFDNELNLKADILESYEVTEGRIFTLKLRKNHKWSDGHPFTSADFKYFWEDVALHEELSRSNDDTEMTVEGKLPLFEVIDDLTVRYTWEKPNPLFLGSLAAPRPNIIYLPAHYMKQFHEKYADKAELDKLVEEEGERNWVSLHINKGRHYRPENPDRPRLDPWLNQTPPPAEQFTFIRNPYFHRTDDRGMQLPYIDKITIGISSAEIIPAKTGSGEVDLQARYLRFSDYTFLKASGKAHNQNVALWQEGKGAQLAIFPNMNTNDETWAKIFRDVRFRRAMSLAIDREELNQQFFFGLANVSANTVMPESPLYEEKFANAWIDFDADAANGLLDEMGLEKGADGIRILPDGRPAEIVIEGAGNSEETDVVELLKTYWLEIGIKVFSRNIPRENLRRRALSGETLLSIGVGLDLGLAVADLAPNELAPTSQAQANWPLWGNYYDSSGVSGTQSDLPEVQRLSTLFADWSVSETTEQRRSIWKEMLGIYSDQVFSIGIVNGVMQPIVYRAALKNIPDTGVFTFAPTAYFGTYHMDTFYFENE
ncbi:MAG: ABC transporter substrate-binding protein [Salaquimonas sp.]